jgi:hypothetical protein
MIDEQLIALTLLLAIAKNCRKINIVYDARNGNVELPEYFLKAKQAYSFRKMEKYKLIYIEVRAGRNAGT